MFILIVAGGYPTQKYPGIGIFEFDQARALAAAGHKVIYAVADLRSIRRWRKWGIEHLTKDGVEIYAVNIPLGRVPHCILRCVGQFGLSVLYNFIKKAHGIPDIVHAHFLNLAEIAISRGKSKLNSSIFVMTEHSSMLNGQYSDLPRWIKDNAANVYKNYKSVICVSPKLAANLKQYFGVKNAVVIFNMLDPVFLTCANDRDIQIDYKDFKFIFVGQIDNRKGPVECIQAFYDAFHKDGFITPEGGRIYLSLIGDGPLMPECKKLIANLKIESYVNMLGFMTRNQIAKIMCASNCFVLPSKLETFGVVYIEAMACGLPVIATKCGGPESFVNETNGVLIDAYDYDALVRAFQYMSENQNKYIKRQIQMFARTEFSPKAISNKLVNLYRALLEENGKIY